MNFYTNSNRRNVIEILKGQVLGDDFRPLSPRGVIQRSDNLPHSFYPLGNGYVMPLGMKGNPIGYYGISPRMPGFDKHQLRHLWIKDDQVDWQHLILGSLLFGNWEELCERAPEPRRVYAVRCHLVLRSLSFPQPKIPRNTFRRIVFDLKREAERRAGRNTK